ncbi:hypothetical protein [Fusobacterium gonidiaformans]|nr:hypothetical protein [Fusobacterium gonidiaformans]EFS29089.1 hypothetical protein FGAG_01410 [Fusobacterium gonidiaformans ATCC 25563]
MRREVQTLEDIRAAFEIYQSNLYYFHVTHHRDAKESDLYRTLYNTF